MDVEMENVVHDKERTADKRCDYHDDFLCVRLLMLLSNDYCCRFLVITSSYRSPSSR